MIWVIRVTSPCSTATWERAGSARIGPPRQQLQMTAQCVQGVPQLVRDGAGELSERGEAFLGGESRRAATSSSFSSSRSRFLLRQLGGRLLDLLRQLGVEPAICASMRLNPRARYASSSPPLPRSRSVHVEQSTLHRAHRELQGGDAADEDPPEQDPEWPRRGRRMRPSPPAARPCARRRPGAPPPPTMPAAPGALGAPCIVERGTSRSARPDSGSSITSPASRVAGPRQRVKTMPPASIRAAVKSASIPRAACRATPHAGFPMGPDGRRQLFRDLIVVVPRVLHGESGGARQLGGALADLLLDGPLRDAQAERAGDESVAARTAVKRSTSWTRNDIQPCCNTERWPRSTAPAEASFPLGLLDLVEPFLKPLMA